MFLEDGIIAILRRYLVLVVPSCFAAINAVSNHMVYQISIEDVYLSRANLQRIA